MFREDSADDLVRELKSEGIEHAEIIGRVAPDSMGKIFVE